MNLGQRIREAREELGMQRTVLARRLGVAPNTVWRWEAGDREPSMALLEKIARVLRTDMADLMREPSVPLGGSPQGGDIPNSLAVLLERRGARTRHLADENLTSKLRESSLEEANKIADEVCAEVEAIAPDVVGLREASRHDPKAASLWTELQNRRWIAELTLDSKLASKQRQQGEGESEFEAELSSIVEDTLRKFREQDLVLEAAT